MAEPLAPVAVAPTERFSRAALFVKRAVDLAVAIPACIVLAPLFIVVALLIRFESPGPAFFRQQRRGLGMQPFTMIKFRSLRPAPDPSDRYEMQESDPRITRIGAFIRRTSIDELPQLFNVIAGTMSVVGPRPLVEWESQDAFRSHPRRFDVKPGLTGWSQITVRNSVDFDGRLDHDLEYVDRFSNAFDLEILIKTPYCVLRRDAIYPDSGDSRH